MRANQNDVDLRIVAGRLARECLHMCVRVRGRTPPADRPSPLNGAKKVREWCAVSSDGSLLIECYAHGIVGIRTVTVSERTLAHTSPRTSRPGNASNGVQLLSAHAHGCCLIYRKHTTQPAHATGFASSLSYVIQLRV